MSLKLNGVLQRKLALLDKQVSNLELNLKDIPFENFKDNWVLRSMTERALQVCAEIVIDIAERIIAVKGGGPVATARDAVERLVEIGILSSAEPYSSIVRFRNLIVHQYEEIDPQILYQTATQKLGDLRRFRNEIDRASASRPDPAGGRGSLQRKGMIIDPAG